MSELWYTGFVLPVSNVAETEDGRNLLVTISFAREMFDELLVGWMPVTGIRLQQIGSEIVFVFQNDRRIGSAAE